MFPFAQVIIGGVSPSLIPHKFKRYFKGMDIDIFEGRDLELEKFTPDFGITGYNYSYGFTSRGCPNSCEWCVVPRLEGKQKKDVDWRNQIDSTLPEFFSFDNNILACGSDHLRDVLGHMHKHKIKVDFNQAMDAEIFHKNKKIQEVFLEFPKVWKVIRFAWDSDRVRDSIIYTMDFLHEHKISAPLKSLLMLYDSDDSPEVVFARIKTVLEHPARFTMKMMRFKDLDTGVLLRKWGGIGDLFAHTLSFVATGNISAGGKFWDYMFNSDLEDFIFKATYMKQFQKISPNNDTKNYIKFVESKRK